MTITLTREEAQNVLNLLIVWLDEQEEPDTETAIETLRAKLSEPKQEPVAWMYVNSDGECEQIEYGEPFDDPSVTPLYTAPPQRKECLRCGEINPAEIHTCTPQREWVWLTDADIDDVQYNVDCRLYRDYARAIEAKLREKNGG